MTHGLFMPDADSGHRVMSMPSDSSGSWSGRKLGRAARVVVVSSVMFTFISYWRTAAVVLCDMSSTVYYIGAIVESAIGKAAPWFIVAVLLFSYGMRSVYIESCALFVRGGVYKVVKEAMGGFLAKLSVSALLFDYVLTGPISGVSAGQYIVNLGLETYSRVTGVHLSGAAHDSIAAWGSVAIACMATLYFLRQNLLGIHESSGKALKIMIATTVMAVIMLGWSGITLVERSLHPDPAHPMNAIPSWQPDLSVKTDLTTGEKVDPLGWIGDHPAVAEPLRNPTNWFSFIGVVGIIIAFGHSILAMSGEETLAQVYREVESPKLPNFKKAAFIVFLYSLLLTGIFNFIAMLLIPDDQRMGVYKDNWLGGLAMQMVGPTWLRLVLNGFVVVVGFLILSGAVNTSIVGSNGVLGRVAEDGVLPDWFLKPHKRYGTTSRLLWLITGMQLFTIIVSRGDVIMLGEAYAFGVVWSFVFKTLSMIVLRFKDRSPREFMVPFNFRWGNAYVPVGLGFVFLIVLLSAVANFVTKPVATISGIVFTAAFLVVFIVTERYHLRRRGADHKHEEQFNRASIEHATGESLGLKKTYRKLVAIRSPHNLFMLEKALADTDPQTTDVVVMTAKVEPPGGSWQSSEIDLDPYDRKLMTAVVDRAERLGKRVLPLIVPTNNPLNAVLTTAKDIGAQEVMLGASNKFTAEEQLDQIALYWINLNSGQPRGLTLHIISADRDVSFDLDGGNRIPRAADRLARSVNELRAAGIGVRKVLMVHNGSLTSHDVFEWLLTMLLPEVDLDFIAVSNDGSRLGNPQETLLRDRQQAEQLGRKVKLLSDIPQNGPEIVQLARDGNYDLIVVPWAEESRSLPAGAHDDWVSYVLSNSSCSVFLASHAALPKQLVS
jgi:amino acid transporter/nucleotide-binding universal stress UspA family protein